MKLLLDMNLAPAWVQVLNAAGWEAVHWSSLGNAQATDAEIMTFARKGGWVVFTHDLDFGAILAHTRGSQPSVFQVRAQNVAPDQLSALVLQALHQFSPQLEAGALVSVDARRQRVRILPLT